MACMTFCLDASQAALISKDEVWKGKFTVMLRASRWHMKGLKLLSQSNMAVGLKLCVCVQAGRGGPIQAAAPKMLIVRHCCHH